MYVLFLKPTSILLCLSRKHNTDYSLVNTTQTKTFDLLSVTGISKAEYFSYLEQILFFQARLLQVMLMASLAVCWCSPHGLIMQYPLLVWERPSFTPQSHCPLREPSLCGLACPNDFFFSFTEKHGQVFLSPNHQGFREHSWAENLRDRLQHYLLSSMNGRKLRVQVHVPVFPRFTLLTGEYLAPSLKIGDFAI